MKFPGEALIIKIMDTCQLGIGSSFRPWQIKREGKAASEVRRDEQLLLTQAKVDAEDIKAGRKAYVEGELVALPPPSSDNVEVIEVGKLPPFLSTANDEAEFLSTTRAINLRSIALYAQEEAESIDDNEVSEEPVDPDWFARWRGGAQDVSKEQMQRLWAKMLVGEVKSPGSYSHHSVSMLTSFGAREAEWLSLIGPYVIKSFIYKDNDEYYGPLGLTIDVLYELQGLGVIAAVESIGGVTTPLNFTNHPKFPDKTISGLFMSPHGIVIVRDGLEGIEQLPIIKITNVGKEILSLGNFPVSKEAFIRIGKCFLKKGYEVYIGDAREIKSGEFALSNEQPLHENDDG